MNMHIRSQVAMLLRTESSASKPMPTASFRRDSSSRRSGERNKNYIRTTRLFLDNDNWGLVRHFGTWDVRDLTTRDWQLFIEKLSRKRSDLSSSTRNMLMATFRNVLKVARDDGLIDVVPATPRQRQKDNPRSFFRFAPLVEPERDEYQQLLQGAKRLADEHAVVRGVEVTGELYDLILFCVHSFVRPTSTELYALKHNDITVEKDPKRLLVTVRNGKTGYRVANTMSGAVSAYERIKARYPDAGGEDYLFLPDYPNRATASRIFQRQFNQLLDETGLKYDPVDGDGAQRLLPAPHRDLHADHPLTRQGQHLQPRQECWHQR